MSFVVQVSVHTEESDRIAALLWEQGTAGVQEEELPGGLLLLSAYFEDTRSAEQCAVALQGWACTTKRVAVQDWSHNQQRTWQAIEIGRRLYLAPPWNASPTPEGRERLEMQPGYVFGAGDHPTTQLCLELLDDHLCPADRVLDVGTGTGILAIAAARLGASHVVACDLDSEATALSAYAARQAGKEISIWQGSTECCRATSASLVLANLPGGALIDLLPELQRVLQPQGLAIVSGFFTEQREAVEHGLRQASLAVREWREQGDWSAALLKKQPETSGQVFTPDARIPPSTAMHCPVM